jgi:exonuclease SbcC
MRPVKLIIQGLRSYRQRQEIAFPEGLFAITGQTGAGKSSILEAIVFALYGSSTFEGNNNRILIGDRCDEMLVSLEFLIQKQHYKVTRSLTAKTAFHELTGPDGQLVATKAQEVNDKIEALLGLTRDDFLKTVVLPQGAFQNFLHSTPAKRAELLKNLLELSVLDQIQDEVSQQRTALQSQLGNLQTLRQSLPATPDQGIQTLNELLQTSQSQITQHRLLLQSHQALAKLRTEQELKRQRIKAKLAQIRSVSAPVPAFQNLSDWHQLEALGPELRAKIGALDSEVKSISSQLAEQHHQSQKLRAELNEQFKQHRRANHIKAQLSELSARLQHVEAEASSLEASLNKLEETIPANQETLSSLEAQFGELRLKRQASQVRLSELQRQLISNQNAVKQRGLILEELERNQQRLELLTAKLEPLQKHLAEQTYSNETLDQEVSRLQNEIGIAALCGHLNSGDACPVCQSLLPENWALESPSELSKNLVTAQSALTKARKHVQQLERQQSECLIECQQLERQLTDLNQKLTQLPEIVDQLKLQDVVQVCKLEVERYEQDFEESSSQLHQWKAECQAAVQLLANLQQKRGDLRLQLHKARQQQTPLQQELLEVAQALQVNDPSNLDWLTAVQQKLEIEQQGLEAQELQLQARQQQQSQLSLKLGEAYNSYREQWIRPLEDRLGAIASMQQLAQLLAADTSQPINLSSLQAALRDQTPTDSSLVSEVREAWEQSLQRVEQLESELQQESEGVDQEQTEAEKQLKELLALGGPQSLNELSDHLDSLHREHGQLEAERNQLEAQKLQAADLDIQIAPLQEQVQQLVALAELLGNKAGKNKRTTFSQWLLQQRQEQLIYLASDFLKKFSHGQFGFDPDFQIQDMSTGNSRKTNTLSGGETFLASLALALALSELVSRKGGRLEAFFIDEGFGSLSPECLDRALSALETIAQSGRTIGVISHVSVMAERIEQVWNVTKTPLGSQIQIVSEELRRRLLEEDLKQLQSLALPLFS